MTIEKRGEFSGDPPSSALANHVFRLRHLSRRLSLEPSRAVHHEPSFAPPAYAPPLREMAELSETDFQRLFRKSPVWRAKYEGFLRNVAIALGQSKNPAMKEPLARISPNTRTQVVANTARKSLALAAAFLARSPPHPSRLFPALS